MCPGLPAAGKARKEMGLDEALGNQKVSLHGELVDQEASARGKGAEVNHVLVLLGLVNHELLVLEPEPPLIILTPGSVDLLLDILQRAGSAMMSISN